VDTPPLSAAPQDWYWLYDIPTARLAVLFIAAFVGFYWAGCVFLRPILRQFVKDTTGANDIVGYVLSCFGVFYGLLLGLIAVTAYQNVADAGANVTREAAALSALYEDASNYPAPHGQNLCWLLRDYTRYVIKYAWPLQRRGIVPEEGTIRVDAVQEELLSFQPVTPAQEILHAEALRQFNHFLEARRLRLFSVNSGLPAVMWYAMILGAVLNLAICWLFDMRFITQLVLGGILAAYLGMMMFLIFDMNQPFRGDVSISAEPFEAIYTRMNEE
jgi:Flp pilus assembly pilin Flp